MVWVPASHVCNIFKLFNVIEFLISYIVDFIFLCCWH